MMHMETAFFPWTIPAPISYVTEAITAPTPACMPASRDGRNFAVAGGVAKSVVDVIAQMYPDKEIKVANAEGLKECKKLLQLAKAGKYNGYLLEGMACPGGCVAGAGTMQPVKPRAIGGTDR